MISNEANILSISARLSLSLTLAVANLKNYAKSMVPLPSASIYFISIWDNMLIFNKIVFILYLSSIYSIISLNEYTGSKFVLVGFDTLFT